MNEWNLHWVKKIFIANLTRILYGIYPKYSSSAFSFIDSGLIETNGEKSEPLGQVEQKNRILFFSKLKSVLDKTDTYFTDDEH